MPADRERENLSPQEILKREAEAERAQAELVASGRDNLTDRCPACGSLGSLEDFDGEMRCVDCDEVVAAQRPLGGLGRK